MTSLENLKRFMKPFYQAVTDETLLNEYIVTYVYPECAAAALWEELATTASVQTTGINEIDTGGEKFKYFSPKTMQEVCLKAVVLYSNRCDALKGGGSCAIRIKQSDVAGVPGKPYA